MIETFKRTQREHSNVFKEFCDSIFGKEIGLEIYTFIKRFRTKDTMNMYINVTPESQQRVAFVSFLYSNYGLENLLTAMDIFYKRVRLNYNSFTKNVGYTYFKAIVATPNKSHISNCTDENWPYLGPRDLSTFKKEIERFETTLNYFLNNKTKIESAVLENFTRINTKDLVKVELVEVEQQKDDIVIRDRVVTPLKYKHGLFQCPDCLHIHKEFQKEKCNICGVKYDYSSYKE